eukprot:TRINITY_DN13536_c0_g1_i1.p1 TRINITY_DN13536_c0_g1~~TRINITY_DN13536_c0_g1_i1.p1  ORF type:complete len:555 (+),score=116.76 TRINITY_DN13536_c0_g1_i1:298-1962(+)
MLELGVMVTIFFKKRDSKGMESVAFRSEVVLSTTIVEVIYSNYLLSAGNRIGIKFSDIPEETKRVKARTVGSVDHYICTYKAWCAYYSIPVEVSVELFITYLCLTKCRVLNFSEFPGISFDDECWASSLGPAISALQYDEYFTQIKLSNVISRKETLLEISEVLKRNQTLTGIELHNVSDPVQHGHSFAQALLAQSENDRIPPYEQLHISEIQIKPMEILVKAISSMELLTSLSFASSKLSSKSLSELCKMLATCSWTSNLKFLDFSGNQFDEATSKLFGVWASKIGEKGKLEVLKLSSTGFYVQCLTEFKLFPNFQELDLCNNKFDSSSFVIGLQNYFMVVQSLGHLNLSNTSLGGGSTGREITTMFRALWNQKNIKGLSLDISKNELVGPALASSLAGANNLTSLDLSNMAMKDAHFSDIVMELSKLPNLTWLRLDNVLEQKMNVVTPSLILLANCRNLKHLSMSGSFGREPILAFLQNLNSSNLLTSLNISNNNLTDTDCTTRVSPVVMVQRKLRSFVCDENNFGYNSWNSLLIAVKMNTSLEVYWREGER